MDSVLFVIIPTILPVKGVLNWYEKEHRTHNPHKVLASFDNLATPYEQFRFYACNVLSTENIKQNTH